MSKPPMTAALTWTGDLRFEATVGSVSLTVDGKGAEGPSPMQALALGLAGCMAIDVVDILQKGRHPLIGLEAALSGERAEEPPRRFVRITLHYTVRGEVPPAAVERAIQLSRDKYCSVWHSMRQDTEFLTTFEVHA
ncbi:MAG: OsmC family protein [Vicinamibacterales bacterium]|nr:OsmC family protein [Vicinamibacterales bacterium]